MAASTGSPASRRLTKFTPLTTRPSLTSRQGMTRTLNTSSGQRRRGLDQLERRLRIEPPVIERAAGDRARELFGARLQQGMHVVERGETAGCNHRDRDVVRQ